jgi:hypothetical protein
MAIGDVSDKRAPARLWFGIGDRSMKKCFAFLGCILGIASGSAGQEAPSPPYLMTRSVTLPSTDTDWDYVKFQPGSPRLFMARLKDGLTVFDVDQGRPITTLPNSAGANGPILLPQFDRGYVAMDDGSLMSFQLRTLKVIARTRLAADGGLNSGAFDLHTGRLHIITGTRPAQSTWYTIDPASGHLLATTRFPFRKMDDPASDGKGNIYAPVRMDGIVLKLDSSTLQELGRWTVGCNVSKLHHLQDGHLLGACVGDQPTAFIIDTEAGKVTSRVPIGKGVDALVIDEKRNRIVSSNYEGNMTVIERDGPDKLRVIATVHTRFGARMMDLDRRTGRLYLVNADSTEFPGKDADTSVTRYHQNGFRVETWRPN